MMQVPQILKDYLSLLSVEQRDRVIEAQEWQVGNAGVPGGPRCLIGHAEEGYKLSNCPIAQSMLEPTLLHIGSEFDRFVFMVSIDNQTGDLYGNLDDAVSMLKVEAAKLNGASAQQITALVATHDATHDATVHAALAHRG